MAWILSFTINAFDCRRQTQAIIKLIILNYPNHHQHNLTGRLSLEMVIHVFLPVIIIIYHRAWWRQPVVIKADNWYNVEQSPKKEEVSCFVVVHVCTLIISKIQIANSAWNPFSLHNKEHVSLPIIIPATVTQYILYVSSCCCWSVNLCRHLCKVKKWRQYQNWNSQHQLHYCS